MNEPIEQHTMSIEERCRELFESRLIPTLIIRPGNGKIIYANTAFRGLVKVNRMDEDIDTVSDILRRGEFTDFKEEMIEVLKDTSTPHEYTLKLREKIFSDETQKVLLSFLDLVDEDCIEMQFSETIRTNDEPSVDMITGRQSDPSGLHARIAELERLLAEKDTMYNRFAHVLGHELKAPLTVIKGFAELLDFEFEERDDPETRSILKMIIKTSNRLYSYIEAMYHLSLQDLQSKRYKTADVLNIFESVEHELTSELLSVGMTLRYEKKKTRWKLNPVLLREIMYQLVLSEALCSKTEESNIRILSAMIAGQYCFAVLHTKSDEAAFPENFLSLVERMASVETSRKATTIGYEFSKKLIEQSGGKIAIDRGDQGMNSFYYYLPPVT